MIPKYGLGKKIKEKERKREEKRGKGRKKVIFFCKIKKNMRK